MKMDQITVILPCRAGSERVPNKNTRPFTQDGLSLLEVKLYQLLELPTDIRILLSTNDDLCIEIAERLSDSRILIDARPNHLARASTPLEELIEYFGSICDTELFLWTHVTCPFFGSGLYQASIEQFVSNRPLGFDSLLAVERIQDFLYFNSSPLNFGELENFWPRTQDILPAHRVTSSVFLGPTRMMSVEKNRVGSSPVLFEVNHLASIDIDWQEDFDFARKLWAAFSSENH